MEESKNQFSTVNIKDFKIKMLHWASRFSIFCFLDNSNYTHKHHIVECLLGVGAKRSVTLHGKRSFESLQSFYDENPGWLFGHLGFELTKDVQSTDKTDFSPGYFFEPEILIRISNNLITIEKNSGGETPSEIFQVIEGQVTVTHTRSSVVNIQSRLSRKEYVDIIDKIKAHIRRGDCYELNFCQEFFADDVLLEPLIVFLKLQEISPNPFSAFYRVNENYCMCASPERFLQKTGRNIISQPIKGTARRGNDPETDARLKAKLASSEKDKSENVMIVDLVRNDLSKVCDEGSVHVEEMFGIYAFPQVYQMISTISGKLAAGIQFTEALEATFPMGSMTGAPKKRVLELIAEFESSERGLFSGSIGYIDPKADFDFNVVIRSIFYNQSTKYLSYRAGGGITFHSDPQAEYEECMAKVEAIKKALR